MIETELVVRETQEEGKTSTLEITFLHLRKMLKDTYDVDLPMEAEVCMGIPAGGDYSGTELSVKENPIRVKWKEQLSVGESEVKHEAKTRYDVEGKAVR